MIFPVRSMLTVSVLQSGYVVSISEPVEGSDDKISAASFAHTSKSTVIEELVKWLGEHQARALAAQPTMDLN